MATGTLRDQYKLETTFDGHNTIHTVTTSGIAGQGGVDVQTKWKHKKNLGSGAFGTVWLEEEEGGGGLRAVKRISRDVKVLDWSRELNILAQLRKFLGWYGDPSSIYLVMEYIEHGDLCQYLKVCGLENAQRQARAIITQVLGGIFILHQKNICHRDIKPKVKIADFGLSKDQDNTLLRTDCGTLYYTAPELRGFVSKPRNGSYTELVDIWSLGVLTHEILTLEVPFLIGTPEPDLGSESGLEVVGQPRSPEMNTQLLLDYCCGRKPFPSGALQKSEVDKKAIAFVKALLVADPQSRVSATEALTHHWISGLQRPKKLDKSEGAGRSKRPKMPKRPKRPTQPGKTTFLWEISMMLVGVVFIIVLRKTLAASVAAAEISAVSSIARLLVLSIIPFSGIIMAGFTYAMFDRVDQRAAIWATRFCGGITVALMVLVLVEKVDLASVMAAIIIAEFMVGGLMQGLVAPLAKKLYKTVSMLLLLTVVVLVFVAFEAFIMLPRVWAVVVGRPRLVAEWAGF